MQLVGRGTRWLERVHYQQKLQGPRARSRECATIRSRSSGRGGVRWERHGAAKLRIGSLQLSPEAKRQWEPNFESTYQRTVGLKPKSAGERLRGREHAVPAAVRAVGCWGPVVHEKHAIALSDRQRANACPRPPAAALPPAPPAASPLSPPSPCIPSLCQVGRRRAGKEGVGGAVALGCAQRR